MDGRAVCLHELLYTIVGLVCHGDVGETHLKGSLHKIGRIVAKPPPSTSSCRPRGLVSVNFPTR